MHFLSELFNFIMKHFNSLIFHNINKNYKLINFLLFLFKK